MFRARFVRVLLTTGALVGVVSPAYAATIVFTSEATFLTAIDSGYYLENFSGVTAGETASLNFGPVNGFSYTIDTPPGSVLGLFNATGLVSTEHNADSIRVTFTGAPVTAFGGFLFPTDIDFNYRQATVRLELSDGTIVQYTSSGTSDFRGFVSDGAAFTGFTINVFGSGVFDWPTLDALYVGAAAVTPVPEPATLLLLGTGLGAVAARRRLKKRA